MSQIVSYGGGNNSAAMLVGLWEHGERPDAIVFADTGGEKPHTYAHMWNWMQPWLESVHFPSITVVRADQPVQRRDGTLEAECLRLGNLPSKAYGFGSCSKEWKTRPFEKWARQQGWRHYIRLIGFHAEEPERADRAAHYPEPRRYPLLEWNWGPEECQAAVARIGLPAPGKSACFFCPSSKQHEIRELQRRYPALLARALRMEARALAGEGPGACGAGLQVIKGLGRRFAWADVINADIRQGKLFDEPAEACSDVCFT